MRVISKKKISDFIEGNLESKASLENWYRIVSKSDFGNFSDLRMTFPSADQVSDLTVFNISGNKFRLIAAIHYNRQILYICEILGVLGTGIFIFANTYEPKPLFFFPQFYNTCPSLLRRWIAAVST
jgi:mRNA interferase HigB